MACMMEVNASQMAPTACKEWPDMLVSKKWWSLWILWRQTHLPSAKVGNGKEKVYRKMSNSCEIFQRWEYGRSWFLVKQLNFLQKICQLYDQAEKIERNFQIFELMCV